MASLQMNLRPMDGTVRPDFRQVLNRLDSGHDLSEEQRKEIERVLASEGHLVEMLRAQLAKINRQRRVASQSGFFRDKHERTLAAQRSQIETELAIAGQRLCRMVFEILSASQRATAADLGEPVTDDQDSSTLSLDT
jgi:hypothetical protein